MQAATSPEDYSEYTDLVSDLEKEDRRLAAAERKVAEEKRKEFETLINNPPEWDEGKTDESMDLLNGNPAKEVGVFTGEKINKIPTQDGLVNILRGLPEEDDAAPIKKTLTIPTREEVEAGASTELSLDKQVTHNLEKIMKKFPINSEINVHDNRRAPNDGNITRGIVIRHKKMANGEIYLDVCRIVTEEGETGIKTSEFPASGILRLNKKTNDVVADVVSHDSNDELYKWAKEKSA